MNTVLRQEHKYLLTLMEYKRLDGIFSALLHADTHNNWNGYQIRSLYFDTINNKDFYEKEEGIEVRKKMRIRIYSPSDDFAMLEMKQKQGESQKKRSLKISRADGELLAKGIYEPLLRYEEPFALECFGVLNGDGYIPRTVVEYTRKAYVANENNIRITFDSNIVASETSCDLFRDDLALLPTLDPFLVVLEIKYNGFLLDYIKNIVSYCNSSSLSVSKYALGRSVTLKYNY